jgi:hypothetical protein
MKYLKCVIESLKEVYSEKKYFVISFLFAFLVYAFNPVIQSYKLIGSAFSFKLLFFIVFGFYSVTSMTAFIFLILTAVLAGIVISMSVYLIKRQISTNGIGASGIIIGLLVPACPSCAIGLLGVLGIGGFLTVLPFKGLELGVIGIGLLVFSIVYLSKKIETKVCKI